MGGVFDQGRRGSRYAHGTASNRSRSKRVPATVVVGTQWGDEGKGK
ncbi:MAG: Adenylosuccinate synthetase, partial [Acidimicrobiaceae bacterium]|nr:Adenylosuccinate synthetase [Acidimicrobiaceae bacterium]